MDYLATGYVDWDEKLTPFDLIVSGPVENSEN